MDWTEKARELAVKLGCCTWHQGDDGFGGEDIPHTDKVKILSAALAEVERETLERAAKIADEEGATPESEGGNIVRADACDNVAREIRALAGGGQGRVRE